MEMLQPCRFCGERGTIRGRSVAGTVSVRVLCRNCGAETLFLPTTEDAVRVWNQGYYTIPSQSERKILDACISLMGAMVESFKEYCDYMGWDADPENEEERFTANVTYREIVNRLFLWNTNHSGGTSTEAKCRELGIEDGSKRILFAFADEEAD